MFHKAVKIETEVNDNKNELTMYASTFNDIDHVRERVITGAFKKTIKERFTQAIKTNKISAVKVLWQHRDPFGIPIHIEEDSKGLLTVSKITDNNENKDRISYIKDGVVDSASIGYDVIKASEAKDIDGVIDLKELKLWEYSPVTFACNENARILDIKMLKSLQANIAKSGGDVSKLDYFISIMKKAKALSDGLKESIKFADLPLADLDTNFDAKQSLTNVKNWSGVLSGDFNKFAKGFLWVNDVNKEVISSYMFQIADIVDGELKAIPQAIFKAAYDITDIAVIKDMSDKDIKLVKEHLEKYYLKMQKDFDDNTIKAPWKKENQSATLDSVLDAIEKGNTLLDSLIKNNYQPEKKTTDGKNDKTDKDSDLLKFSKALENGTSNFNNIMKEN